MADAGNKAFYIDPAGDARTGSLPVRPPFRFSGVTSRVFPLKANMARLTAFCDQYVNMDIPSEIAHYRPALPYVYLMVLDYGSMSSASTDAQNVGWVAQHEVAFTVPLQRWRKEKGQLVFKDWACVSPFIFVDDEMSLTTGREVYGWPKVAGRVDATLPLWHRHPTAGSRLFTFSTHVFPKVYSGETESLRVLLQIDADAPLSYSEIPPDPSTPWSPWSVWSNATRSSLSLIGNALDMMLALRVRGYRTNRNLRSLSAMGGKAGDYLMQMVPTLLGTQRFGLARSDLADRAGPTLAFDNVTIKQFRDAQEPDRACYKALVHSAMGIERINRSGLLGDANLLRGDPSGGHSIRIHRYASQPIIESLGLEVQASEETGAHGSVALLKPTLPFWTDVDLYYGAGEVICSRTHIRGDCKHDVGWVDGQPGAAEAAAGTVKPEPRAHAAARAGNPDDAHPAAEVRGSGPAPDATHSAEAENSAGTERSAGAERSAGTEHSAYNTALGAATQPMVGPFHFPDVTLQVYPLLADRMKLDRCIDAYLNEPLKDAGQYFRTMGSYAYLMVQSTGDQHGTMWSSANNIGWWAEREVSLCVPVKWYCVNGVGGEELVSVAMVALFVYSSNGRAVITDREVNGRPTVQATISSPKDVWLDESGPDKPRQYLRLDTEVFPALGYGQEAEQRTLLEIDGRDVLADNDDVGWRLVAERWGPELVNDLMLKTEIGRRQAAEVQAAKALALEVLAHGAPVNWLVLKQYRDAAEVEKACYQALVRTTRAITRIYDVREIEDRVHVRVHRVAGHPIVKALGLKVKSLDSSAGSVVQNLQPLRPFWMRISVKEQLGAVVAVRRADGTWAVHEPWCKTPSNADSAPASLAAVPAEGPGAEAPSKVEPYFRARGQTRVSAQWQLAPQQLRAQATLKLRNALYSSLRGAVAALGKLQQASGGNLRGRLSDHYWKRSPVAEKLWLELFKDEDPARADVATFAEAHGIDDLLALERAFVDAGLEWDPESRSQERLSVEQARDAVEKLEDVQVVLEAILQAEWENWGNPRWSQNQMRRKAKQAEIERKPAHCIPAHSVAAGLKTLAPYAKYDKSAPKLECTSDGAWLSVGAPRGRKGAKGTGQQ